MTEHDVRQAALAALAALAVVVPAAGCGSGDRRSAVLERPGGEGSRAVPAGYAPEGYTGRFRGSGLVLQSPDSGPRPVVLNLRFTGDPSVHENDVRRLWGGPLCLSRAEYTYRELTRAENRVQDELDWRRSGVDVLRNRLVVDVPVAWWRVQEDLDRRYGRGAVVLDGYLEPID